MFRINIFAFHYILNALVLRRNGNLFRQLCRSTTNKNIWDVMNMTDIEYN